MDSTDYVNLKHFFGSMREDPKKHKELLDYIAKHPEYVIKKLKLTK